ncbi:MAG: hypothetical protein JRJ59_01175 [Deltaproteobacteria bacterium]|nr:hypothetical protein [Deltaproteobacteria bacterium]
MIYRTRSGEAIDTARQLNFEERNFVQKMMIYEHLELSLEEFQGRWRRAGNPVWTGPETLARPSPAVRIILDLESKIKARPAQSSQPEAGS